MPASLTSRMSSRAAMTLSSAAVASATRPSSYGHLRSVRPRRVGEPPVGVGRAVAEDVADTAPVEGRRGRLDDVEVDVDGLRDRAAEIADLAPVAQAGAVAERRVDRRRRRHLEDRQAVRPGEELRHVEGLAAAEPDDRGMGRQARRGLLQVGQLEGVDEVDAGEVAVEQRLERGHRSAIVTTRYGRWTKAGSSATSSRPKTVRKPRTGRARRRHVAVAVRAGGAGSVPGGSAGMRVRSLKPSRTRPRPSAKVRRRPPLTSARSSRPPTSTRSCAVGPSKMTRSIVALDDVLEVRRLAVLEDDDVLRPEVGEDPVADAGRRPASGSAGRGRRSTRSSGRRRRRPRLPVDGPRQPVVGPDELGHERGLRVGGRSPSASRSARLGRRS